MNVLINASCTAPPRDAEIIPSDGDVLLNLLSSLNYDRENPPLAALLSKQYQLEGDWVILTPVHWQATHNNVVISTLNVEYEQELKTCFHRLAEHFIAVGMALYYHDPYTWLLSTNYKSLLQAKTIHSIAHKPLMNELAQIDATMYWQKLLTECQMFFSSMKEETMVNGVWAWSSSALEEKSDIKLCVDSYFLPLAELCSTNVSLYQSECALSDIELLLLNDLDVLSKSHRAQLDRRATLWCWNNLAYRLGQKTNWFTRLWRSLNAH